MTAPPTATALRAVPALPTWREAWQQALYDPDGFYLRQRPGDHFRTSVHASSLFAEAVQELARRHGLRAVTDVGAGGGELLAHLAALDSGLQLIGVDLAPRPRGLPDHVGWRSGLPERLEGLVIANEWLDNIACDVVEVDDSGVPRVVHVDPQTGDEQLGRQVEDPWLDTWWPLEGPGNRAEVGAPRDTAWDDVVGRLTDGLAIAVDYGHTREDRPARGSLTSYQDGRMVEPIPDGTRDITAHVAVDSLPADRLVDQRSMLHTLGIRGERPAVETAHDDPRGYVRTLSRASQAAELTAVGGLGDFTWAMSTR